MGAVAAGALWWLTTPASAHAYLDSTDPADGQVLARMPAQVVLHFTEPVLVAQTAVTLVDSRGRSHPARSVGGPGERGGVEPKTVVAALDPSLPSDAYHLRWRTVSADDLHRSEGELVFGVGRTVRGSGLPPDPAPAPAESLLRWLALTAGATLSGVGLADALLRRHRADGYRTARRTRLLAGVAGATAMCTAAGVAWQQSVGAVGAGETAGFLLKSHYGHHWLLQEAGIVALLLAVRSATRTTWSPRWKALAAVGLGGYSFETALLGHASTAGTGRVIVTALHLAAATTWLGGVLGVAVVLAPGLRDRKTRWAAASALRAFAPWAGGSLMVLVVTGLVLAGRSVPTVEALLLSVYGRTLLVKLALAGAAACLGLLNHYRVRRLAGPNLTGLVRVEAGTLLLVVLGSAVLASAAPATGPRWTPPVRGTTPVGVSGNAGDLVETLTVRPNLPGRNIVTVHLFDTRRPSPGAVTDVRVALTGPGGRHVTLVMAPVPAPQPAPADQPDDGSAARSSTWNATVEDLGSPGAWRLMTQVTRPGLAVVASSYPWKVGSLPSNARVSATRLLPVTDRAAAALLVLLAVALGARGHRRRRGDPSLPAARPVTAQPELIGSPGSHPPASA